jgi:membrane-bound lytic murein transglycosylase D
MLKVPSMSQSVWIAITLFLSACSTTQSRSAEELNSNKVLVMDVEPSVEFTGLPEESVEAIREIEKEILDANAEIEKTSPEISTTVVDENLKPVTHLRIPLEINESVLKWIRYFTVTDRERFHLFLKRGSAYRETVKEILKKNGVPAELYYLAMIESGYATQAKSKAKAVGIWQFMSATGLRYGLRQSRYVDERVDVIRATDAASKYLLNLHTAFQSWYLAMAGYNAGEGRILGAIMRGETRDFWKLVEKKALPAETRDYIPKFLAAAIIGRNPEKYGFKDISSPSFPTVEAAEVPGGVRLETIAQKAGLSQEDLKTVNPQLLRSMTPSNMETYTLWVPKGKSSILQAMHTELASMRQRDSHQDEIRFHRSAPTKRILVSHKVKRSSPLVHKVRRGERLTLISKKYDIPVNQLKRMNNLRNSKIQAGQRLIVRNEN